jgi:hypothetical protein
VLNRRTTSGFNRPHSIDSAIMFRKYLRATRKAACCSHIWRLKNGNLIACSDVHPDDITFYASFPVLVDGFLVSTVIGLQTSVLESHYEMTKASVPLHECRDIPVARSIIDAVIQQVLISSADELQKPDAGASFSAIGVEETLRAAAAQLMTDAVWRIDQNRHSGMHSLYTSCNTIASLHYERQSGSGTIILARREHPAVQRQLIFQTPTDKREVFEQTICSHSPTTIIYCDQVVDRHCRMVGFASGHRHDASRRLVPWAVDRRAYWRRDHFVSRIRLQQVQ